MKRLTTGVAAVLLALVVTSCGDNAGSGGTSTGTNTGSETAGGGDATAWAEKVCSGMKDDVTALTTTPEIDQTNPQAAKDGLTAYLGTLATSLDGMAGAVQDAGTPPVDGGDEAVKTFLDQIATAKDAVTSAKTSIEGAPITDVAAFQAAAADALGALEALSEMEDPLSSFNNNKELKAAYEEAASCKELQGSLSSPTS